MIWCNAIWSTEHTEQYKENCARISNETEICQNVSFVIAFNWYISSAVSFSVFPKCVCYDKQVFLLWRKYHEKYFMHSLLFQWPMLAVVSTAPPSGVSGHPAHIKSMSHSLPPEAPSGRAWARLRPQCPEPGSDGAHTCYGREHPLSSSITWASPQSHILQDIWGLHLHILQHLTAINSPGPY